MAEDNEGLVNEDDVQKAMAEQAKGAPMATLEQLKSKRKVSKTIALPIGGEGDDVTMLSMKFEAIPAVEYDKLVEKHPPKGKAKKEGFVYDPDTFGPALVAATCVEPEMTEEDAVELWTSDVWNRSERMMMFMAAIEVCTGLLDVPKRSSVSG